MAYRLAFLAAVVAAWLATPSAANHHCLTPTIKSVADNATRAVLCINEWQRTSETPTSGSSMHTTATAVALAGSISVALARFAQRNAPDGECRTAYAQELRNLRPTYDSSVRAAMQLSSDGNLAVPILNQLTEQCRVDSQILGEIAEYGVRPSGGATASATQGGATQGATASATQDGWSQPTLSGLPANAIELAKELLEIEKDTAILNEYLTAARFGHISDDFKRELSTRRTKQIPRIERAKTIFNQLGRSYPEHMEAINAWRQYEKAMDDEILASMKFANQAIEAKTQSYSSSETLEEFDQRQKEARARRERNEAQTKQAVETAAKMLIERYKR